MCMGFTGQDHDQCLAGERRAERQRQGNASERVGAKPVESLACLAPQVALRSFRAVGSLVIPSATLPTRCQPAVPFDPAESSTVWVWGLWTTWY